MALEMGKINAKTAIHLHDLLADPEDEAERERIAEVEVGQDPEGKSADDLQRAGMFGGLGHDGNGIAAGRLDGRIGAGEGMQLEPAIAAPWPAVEADHQRSTSRELLELDETSLTVGQAEILKRFADFRHLAAGIVVGQTSD